MIDPWAPLPGFEPYETPHRDNFSQPDTKASELRAFLQSDEFRGVRNLDIEASVSWVKLPSGATAQLTRKAADQWELAVPLGRDWFQVIEASSREEVLRKAGEV